MHRSCFQLVAAISTIAVNESASAQSVGAQVPGPSHWLIEWRVPYCVATAGSAKELGMSIWAVPGSDDVKVYLAGARVPKLDDHSNVVVQVAPGGGSSSAQAWWPLPVWNEVIALGIKDTYFLDRFAGSSQLTIAGSGKTVSIGYDQADEVVRWLKECSDAHARQWGLDPAALRALKAFPEAKQPGWITASDYPQDAIEESASGFVAIRLAIDATGKLKSCDVVANTGTPSMAKVTCDLTMKRASFNPAIGPDGRPTPASMIIVIAFATFG